jgi:hypothetical protein
MNKGVNVMHAHNAKTLHWIKPITPAADETLASFVYRWAKANTFPSRVSLLRALDVTVAIRTYHTDLEKLAAELRVPINTLEKIAPDPAPKIAALRRSFTRPSSEAVCPCCLADDVATKKDTYSRQLWSHALAIACPTHGVHLIDRCQHCSKPVRHDRPMVRVCSCGADLSRQTSIAASAAEVAFSSLLCGLEPANTVLPFDLSNGVPEDIDLFVIGLANQLLDRGAGKEAAKVGKTPNPKSVADAVRHLGPVFHLFETWPHNFDEKLRTLIEEVSPSASTGAAARFGRWYTHLFRKHRHVAYEPLRIAAANRIVISHDGVLNARTHSVQNIATVQKNWYSVKEAAVELHVSTERINEGIDKFLIEARIHDESAGYRQRLIALKEIQRLRQLQYEHIDDTAAREILQVPKAVYSLMCDAEWITRASANDIAPVVSGYIQHVPLLALIEKLRSSGIENAGHRWGAFVHLRQLNLRKTTDLQRMIHLYRAIAVGELKPIGIEDGLAVGGLMFSQPEIDQRIASWFVARGLTLQQVSALLGEHYDAVKAWVLSGHLPATREPMEQGSPWVIDLQDLITFLQTYASLASQAKASDSTSRGLATRLQLLGINPIEPEGGRGALVRLPDIFGALKKAPSATAQ